MALVPLRSLPEVNPSFFAALGAGDGAVESENEINFNDISALWTMHNLDGFHV
jgi:hypothetical protein